MPTFIDYKRFAGSQYKWTPVSITLQGSQVSVPSATGSAATGMATLAFFKAGGTITQPGSGTTGTFGAMQAPTTSGTISGAASVQTGSAYAVGGSGVVYGNDGSSVQYYDAPNGVLTTYKLQGTSRTAVYAGGQVTVSIATGSASGSGTTPTTMTTSATGVYYGMFPAVAAVPAGTCYGVTGSVGVVSGTGAIAYAPGSTITVYIREDA